MKCILRFRQVMVLGLVSAFILEAAEPGKIHVLFREDFKHGLGAGWKSFPRFSGQTSYQAVREGANEILVARAEAAGSGLTTETHLRISPGTFIQWRWKIDRVPTRGSDRQIEGFDHAARIFVAFHTFIGPPRSVNYVWANQTPIGQTFPHPHTRRAQFLVLETGNAKAGRWLTERRDLSADYKRLFHQNPPEMVGIGFITDADDTKETVVGYYGDVTIFQR